MTKAVHQDSLSAPSTTISSGGDHGQQAMPAGVPKICRGECEAALIIDAAGHIAAGDEAAAALLGRRSEDLPGQHVSALIRGLPFDPQTPGYNLAYAGFHGGDGVWMRHTMVVPEGREIAVEVSLANRNRDGSPCIVLCLRPPASAVGWEA